MRITFVLLASMILSGVSFADEPKKLPEWEKNAEMSVLLTSGNTSVKTIGLGAGAIYRPEPWTFKGNASFLTSSSSGTKTAEAYTGLLRAERNFTTDLSGFLSVNYLKNVFAGFNDRIGAEAGVAYLILNQGAHSLSSELGAGMINESRTDLVKQTFASARVGLTYKWKLSDTADFTNTFSVLDNLSTTRDWRLSNVAAITAVLTEVLSMKVSFQVDHLNVPVAGKKSTDTATTLALVAKF